VKETKSYKRSRLKPRLRLVRLKSGWPFLVWLGAVCVLAYLFLFRTQVGTLTGVVDTVAEPVAAIETARLADIMVTIGERVKAGQILAHMDTAVVDAEIQQIDAEIQEAENSIGNFERQTLGTIRTFEDAIKDAQAAIEDLKRQTDRDTALLSQMKEQQSRYDDLFDRKLIDAAAAHALKPSIAALERELEAYPAMMAVEERRLDDSIEARRQLYNSLQLRDGEAIQGALQRRAEDQKAILEAAREARVSRRNTYTLRATRDGIVSRIFHHPGHIVPGGEPILRLIMENSRMVIGFLPEVHLTSILPNQRAYVWRHGGTGDPIPAHVVTIAPEVDNLPARMSPLSTQMLRGRRVIFEIEENHDLVPGETVQIRLARSVTGAGGLTGLSARLFDAGGDD